MARLRRKLVLPAALGVVVVLAVLVIIFRRQGDSGTTAGTSAAEAGRNLAGAAAVTYTGTYAGGHATFGVTKAGTAHGDFTSGGAPVRLVMIEGAKYLKTGAAFWEGRGAPQIGIKAGGAWAEDTVDAMPLGLADLAPPALARTLEGLGNTPKATKTKLGGISVVKLLHGGTTYYVSARAPHRLMRIDGVPGDQTSSFAVSPLPRPAAGPLFGELRADVAGLGATYDDLAGARGHPRLKVGTCDQDGCTDTDTVTTSDVADPGRHATVLLKMTIRFSATVDGAPFTTCSASRWVSANTTLPMSCRATGPPWTTFYESHTGRFDFYNVADESVLVNSPADVHNLLGELDREQRA